MVVQNDVMAVYYFHILWLYRMVFVTVMAVTSGRCAKDMGCATGAIPLYFKDSQCNRDVRPESNDSHHPHIVRVKVDKQRHRPLLLFGSQIEFTGHLKNLRGT